MQEHSVYPSMKALMFGWEWPPHNSGGLGVACWGLSRAIAAEGVDLTFVLPRRVKASAPWAKIVFADLSHLSPEMEALRERLFSGYITAEQYELLKKEYPELAHLQGSLFDEVLAYGINARRVARLESHDVIHAHDWLSMLAGIEARKVSGKPLIVHVHATEFDRSGESGMYNGIYHIERMGVHAADKVIAVSNYTKQILVRYYGMDPARIEVVHNGIDQDDTTVVQSSEEVMHALKRRGMHIVLFVGRITMQKGPEYFLRAARRVLEKRPNTVFLFAGSGDLERRTIQEAAYYGIGDKVIFLGFMRGESLAKLYKLCDVFVMPSVSEPFGIVPLEALANGAPVIVSKQSGVAEVLNHALKVDFWDTDEMAEKIIAVLEYEALRSTMRDNGKREVFGLVWKKAAEKCNRIYETVVQSFYSQGTKKAG